MRLIAGGGAIVDDMINDGNRDAAHNRLLAWRQGVEPPRVTNLSQGMAAAAAAVGSSMGPDDEFRVRLDQIIVGAAETLDATLRTREELDDKLRDLLQKIVIAATSTLAWIQDECRGHRETHPAKDRQMREKLKILTQFSKFLRRLPGETTAVCAATTRDGIRLSMTAKEDQWTSPPMWASVDTALPGKSTGDNISDNVNHFILEAIFDYERPEDVNDPTPGHRHVERLKRLIQGEFKETPDGDDVGDSNYLAIRRCLRWYLTAASNRIFWTQACESFKPAGGIWRMPPLEKVTDQRLYSAAEWFFVDNGQHICSSKEVFNLQLALVTIQTATNDFNPIRAHVNSNGRAPRQHPNRDHLIAQQGDVVHSGHWKAMLNCEKNVNSLREVASTIWQRIQGEYTNTNDATTCLEHLCQTVTTDWKGHTQGISTQNYLLLVAMMIYSARESLKYFGHMLTLWRMVIARAKSFQEIQRQSLVEVVHCVIALSNAQELWQNLLQSPWTVAWALHILADDSEATHNDTIENDADHCSTVDLVATDDKAEESFHFIRDQENKEATDIPHSMNNVFRATYSRFVQPLLRSSYRLGATTRRQREMEDRLNVTVGAKDEKRILDMEFVPNKNAKVYDEEQVRGFIGEFWSTLSFPGGGSREQQQCGDFLREIAGTPWFSNPQGLRIAGCRHPEAHCECILMNHWRQIHKNERSLPPVGISRLACGTCSYFIGAMLTFVYGSNHPEVKRFVPGTMDNDFWMCMLPSDCPIPVMSEVVRLLTSKVHAVLNDPSMVKLLETQLDYARQNLRSNRGRSPELGSSSIDSQLTPTMLMSIAMNGSTGTENPRLFERGRAVTNAELAAIKADAEGAPGDAHLFSQRHTSS